MQLHICIIPRTFKISAVVYLNLKKKHFLFKLFLVKTFHDLMIASVAGVRKANILANKFTNFQEVFDINYCT